MRRKRGRAIQHLNYIAKGGELQYNVFNYIERGDDGLHHYDDSLLKDQPFCNESMAL